MSLWLADKASGSPPTQTPYIDVDDNLFLLESRMGHATAPHLAGCQLMGLSTRTGLTLMNIMSAEENQSSMRLSAGASRPSPRRSTPSHQASRSNILPGMSSTLLT